MNKKKVAVIGYGALGRILVDGIREKLDGSCQLTGVLVRHVEQSGKANGDLHFYTDIDKLLEEKPDYVVEIASKEAVAEYGCKVLESGAGLIITSVGALAADEQYEKLSETAARCGSKVYVTSGAIGGFDVMQTISMMGNAKASIQNCKAPVSLNGAPYLKGRLLSDTDVELVFHGTAREAIEGFPNNVNVAVASAVASVGVDAMDVIIESRPGLRDNVHRVQVENDSVKATIEISSRPDRNNPKSSVMTAWSVVALLQNLLSPIQLF